MPVRLILQEYIPEENEQPPMPTAEVENIRLIGEGDRQKLSDTVRQRTTSRKSGLRGAV